MGRFINADVLVSTGQGILGNNMFAYCGNNPVICLDPKGTIHYSVTPTAQFCIDVGNSLNIDLDNKYTKRHGMINGQKVFKYADESMGWGTYGNNGCGIIAIYNALQLLGISETLGQIEAEIQYIGGYCAMGLLGIVPWAIDSYFTSHGISCSGYSSFYAMSKDVKEGSIIVFLVLNNKYTLLGGAHYMTAQYSNGEYIVYNLDDYWPEPESRTSLFEPYGNSGFIYGYIVGG